MKGDGMKGRTVMDVASAKAELAQVRGQNDRLRGRVKRLEQDLAKEKKLSAARLRTNQRLDRLRTMHGLRTAEVSA
jgi:hypothetical protein